MNLFPFDEGDPNPKHNDPSRRLNQHYVLAELGGPIPLAISALSLDDPVFSDAVGQWWKPDSSTYLQLYKAGLMPLLSSRIMRDGRPEAALAVLDYGMMLERQQADLNVTGTDYFDLAVDLAICKASGPALAIANSEERLMYGYRERRKDPNKQDEKVTAAYNMEYALRLITIAQRAIGESGIANVPLEDLMQVLAKAIANIDDVQKFMRRVEIGDSRTFSYDDQFIVINIRRQQEELIPLIDYIEIVLSASERK